MKEREREREREREKGFYKENNMQTFNLNLKKNKIKHKVADNKFIEPPQKPKIESNEARSEFKDFWVSLLV